MRDDVQTHTHTHVQKLRQGVGGGARSGGGGGGDGGGRGYIRYFPFVFASLSPSRSGGQRESPWMSQQVSRKGSGSYYSRVNGRINKSTRKSVGDSTGQEESQWMT